MNGKKKVLNMPHRFSHHKRQVTWRQNRRKGAATQEVHFFVLSSSSLSWTCSTSSTVPVAILSCCSCVSALLATRWIHLKQRVRWINPEHPSQFYPFKIWGNPLEYSLVFDRTQNFVGLEFNFKLFSLFQALILFYINFLFPIVFLKNNWSFFIKGEIF